nr:MAG TPA: hypothetical protein [Caudoviricetes sp.]
MNRLPSPFNFTSSFPLSKLVPLFSPYNACEYVTLG